MLCSYVSAHIGCAPCILVSAGQFNRQQTNDKRGK